MNRHATLGELIDQIVNVHHTYLLKTLPELDRYTATIENVHGSHHPELSEVRQLFVRMYKELMIHLPKEEQDMFPAIRKLELEPSVAAYRQCARMIEALEDEHESCGDILRQIRRVTQQYALPPEACPTYTLTFQLLQELETDLLQHMHLENNVLFPRVLGSAM